MKTDTPRTDAARERYYDGKTSDWVHYTICGMIERELAASLENQCIAQTEVARLNNTLENTRISRDTMIEDRNLLDQELTASKAEVAKLNHQLLKTESDLLQSQDINSFLDTEFRIACKRAEKAEEELAALKEEIK
jgi:chromosome segregation ATPase